MISQNPFIVRRDIAYGEPFCDRQHEIGVFMESSASDEPVCLLSPRRYGKSSLVNQVLGKLGEQGWGTLRLDLMSIYSLPELVREIERSRLEISGAWARMKERASDTAARLRPQVEVDPQTGTPSFSFDLSGPRAGEEAALKSALELICALPQKLGRPVCLALDEFQEIMVLDPKKRIEGMIRAVFQRRSRGFLPIYLGSRRHMLKLMFESESAPFYKSARMLELNELEPTAFAEFMESRFQTSLTSLDLPRGLAKATALIFGGHPHAVNITASRLWNTCQCVRNLSSESIVDAWKQAVCTLIEEERRYYQHMNRNIPRYALNVLANITRLGTVPEPYAVAFVKRCDLTASQVQTAMRLLLKEDKVIGSENGYMALDPLEALCFRTQGVGAEAMNESLDRVVSRLAQGGPDRILDL